MKISVHLILAIAILFGLSSQSFGKKKSRMYRLEACDCVGMESNTPTFLSDIMGEPHIETEAKTLALAEKKADRICYKDFRSLYGKKIVKNQVSHSGCKKYINKGNSGDWKSI